MLAHPARGRRSLRPLSHRVSFQPKSRGFTLVEVLTATVLTLILMSLLAGVFAQITDAVNTSRATIELNAQLTGVAYRLQKDLEGYTVRPDPLRKDFHDGYLTVVEGPLGTPFLPNMSLATSAGSLGAGAPDTTLGDRDDYVMLTTRSRHEPFQGRFGMTTISSEVAEVSWFLRGTTLYRRVLLVTNPNIPTTPVASTVAWWEGANRYIRSNVTGGPPSGPYQDTSGFNSWDSTQQAFYGYADVSVRLEGGSNDPDSATRNGSLRLTPNTLGDLSVPRNRYCWPASPVFGSSAWLSDVRAWAPGTTFGLPVLGECSHPNFPFPAPGGTVTAPSASGSFDQLMNRHPFTNVNVTSGRMTAYPDPASDPNNYRRINEDVIMTNVLSFDVKVWDPGAPIYSTNAGGTPLAVMPGDVTPVAYTSLVGGGTVVSYGAYVNLGYAPGYTPNTAASPPQPPAHFNGLGDPRSYLQAVGGSIPVCMYDTHTNQYDNDGIDQDSSVDGGAGPDQANNGYDDNAIGGIDDVTEREIPPPYPFPLRGLQITIRVIEPDTQQIREVVVQQDFVME